MAAAGGARVDHCGTGTRKTGQAEAAFLWHLGSAPTPRNLAADDRLFFDRDGRIWQRLLVARLGQAIIWLVQLGGDSDHHHPFLRRPVLTAIGWMVV